jgi:hypothetical protein
LEDEVARAAETGQPENLSILQTRELERSVPYAAGAEQRSRFCITENVGNRVSVLLRNDYELGVPAIRVASCRPEVVTQVFCDIAGGRVNPANTHSIADFMPLASDSQGGNPTDNLVSGNDRQSRRFRPALYFV